METEILAVTGRIARKNGGKLPRGIHRRGKSLVVSFALTDGTIERRSLGPVSVGYAHRSNSEFSSERSARKHTRNVSHG
jgi:hypothetical protein